MEQEHTLRTVIIGGPLMLSSVVHSIIDVLVSAGRDWEVVHGRRPGPARFAVSLRTGDGAPYRDPHDRVVAPDGPLGEPGEVDIVIVPAIEFSPLEPMPASLLPIAGWIAEARANGALVCSVCSGAFLLAAAGLLDDCEATTHWAFADALARQSPAVRVRAERILVPAGEGHSVVTSGAASAWSDLVLYLVRRFCGEETARHVAKLWLLQPHLEGQLAYASLGAGRQHEDALVARVQVWAADNYPVPNPVGEMARLSGLTERSFLRRFKRSTGMTPVEYVQVLRVEEAKQMLETTDMTVESIAAEVGYVEPSSFRAAFRRHVGLPASAYRRKWSTRAPTPVRARGRGSAVSMH